MMRTVVNAARRSGLRFACQSGPHEIPAKLPDLPYDFNALEPVISADIMKLHWDKHHRAYVNNFNASIEKLDAAEKKGDVAGVVNLQSAIKFNGGGHVNHSIFWHNLAPPKSTGGGQPDGDLLKSIQQQFGSYEKFVETMNAQTAAIQGSGWGWLGYNPTTGNVQIATCPNQDTLQLTTGLVPLLGIDIWEHAFYLQYKNDKLTYLKEIWKVVNWKDVAQRFDAARGKK